MSRPPRSQLLLTERALRDIEEIYQYSADRWGKRTADKYVDELEAALERLKSHPELLQPQPDLHPALAFYLVNKHLVVCDRQEKAVVVLTVIHTSMDIPCHLATLQPTLPVEVEILHSQLAERRTKPS